MRVRRPCAEESVWLDGSGTAAALVAVPGMKARLPCTAWTYASPKDIPLPAGFRLGLIAEGCNILNHENYGAYQSVLNQTQFGAPRQALLNAYQPRVAQLAFKVSF